MLLHYSFIFLGKVSQTLRSHGINLAWFEFFYVKLYEKQKLNNYLSLNWYKPEVILNGSQNLLLMIKGEV